MTTSTFLIDLFRKNVFCFLFSLISIAAAAQAQLLTDINTSPETTYNEFSNLRDGLGKVYYVSQHQDLWVNHFNSNGEEVASKLKSFTHVDQLLIVGNTLYFSADDGSHGEELWKTNGTAGGTVMVKDIWSGSSSGAPQKLTMVNSVLYFTAANKDYGRELWKSNGSAAGTILVKDIFPKVTGSNPAYLTNVKGVVYFSASDGSHGYELWKSDGTTAGTLMVKDIKAAYKIGSGPQQIVNINGVVYFTATEDATGRELYKSNGTADGTVIVKDIRPGKSSSGIENMTAVNSVLFFTANDGIYGHELWKTLGTAGSTVLVKDMTPGYAGSHGESASSYRMSNFKNISGLLFYTAYKNEDYYIWTSNGTAAGTVAHYLAAGPNHRQPRPLFTQMNDMVFFFNSFYAEQGSDINEYSLVKTNLTASLAEPEFVQELHNSAEVPHYPEVVVMKDLTGANHLYFNGTDGWESITLFKSNGYAEGTEILYYADPFYANQSSNPHNFLPFNGKIVFLAQYQFYGSEDIYITDGTEAGTSSLVGFEGPALEIVTTDNFIYGSGVYHLEIYRSSENYAPPFGYFSWSDGGPPAMLLTPVNEDIFFTNTRGELWRIAASSDELTLLKTIGTIRELKALGTNLIFRVMTASNGEELWRSNGTTAGTYRYKTVRTATARSSLKFPSATIKNTHYFVANDVIHGNEIWKTQGSAASTYMLTDLNTIDPTATNGREYDISTLAVFRDSLYISAMGNDQAWSLYKYRSNAAAVIKVTNLNAVKVMVPVGNELYLFTYGPDQRSGLNLWKTNGTSQGTIFIKELPESDNVQYYLKDGILYFNLNNGSALWRSDGTECGTYSFETGIPVFDLTGINSTLIFNGLKAEIGMEPYTYKTAFVPESPCYVENAMSSLIESKALGYPNPFTNEFNLNVPGKDGEFVSVIITTVTGFPVEKIQNIQANIDHHIGQMWAPGMYIIKVLKGNNGSSTILVKEK